MSCWVDRLHLISEKQEGKEGEREVEKVGGWREKEREKEKDNMSVG